VSADAVYRDALETIFMLENVHIDDAGDKLRDYWEAPPPGAADDDRARMPDFGSLEDFAALYRIPPAKLARLRRFLTAQPGNRLNRINVNTAPEEVLHAVLVGYGTEGGGDAMQQILERRLEDPPFQNQGEVLQTLSGIDDRVRVALTQMLGTNSKYFRLQASALTNADPTGVVPGGIGQTLSVLVFRSKRINQRGGRTNQRTGGIGQRTGGNDQQFVWTFRRLDWQKEAGARLFREPEAGLSDAEGEEETDEDDADFPANN
jgi:hypothetical protein